MIYLLEFSGKLYEFKRSWTRSNEMLYSILENTEDTMLLHKHDLCFGYKNKFQISDPDKIDFSKIYGKNVILYHLDIYLNVPEKIVTLIKFCIENDMNLYAPICDGIIPYYIRDKSNQYLDIIEILKGYKHILYDFKVKNEDFEIQRKSMIRDLNLRKLLD